ncbi:MAG: hypothetical protein NTX61_08695 [Bacteroidetes bacterium]|nr:hypothetical protein [Bacteroidota bacterium]
MTDHLLKEIQALGFDVIIEDKKRFEELKAFLSKKCGITQPEQLKVALLKASEERKLKTRRV